MRYTVKMTATVAIDATVTITPDILAQLAGRNAVDVAYLTEDEIRREATRIAVERAREDVYIDNTTDPDPLTAGLDGDPNVTEINEHRPRPAALS